MSGYMGWRSVAGLWIVVVAVFASGPAAYAEAALSLAGSRRHFNVAEPVELAVVAAGEARLVVRHADGSSLELSVPVGADASARMVSLKAGALKPGRYTATLEGAAGESVAFTIHQAEHTNAYFTGQWVHDNVRDNYDPIVASKGGWMFMNTDYAGMHPRTPAPGDLAEAYVAAGMKPYTLMVLGGGHQLDLELRSDWGDPWVQRAVIWRTQLAALSNRIYPIGGLQMYDEPGLTHWPIMDEDGEMIGMNPFAVPHQLREFERLTGVKMPVGPLDETVTQYKPMLDKFVQFITMRLKYLEQTSSAITWATDSVHSDFGVLNQMSSSYAAGTVADGVDGRQARPFDVISGHGGYSVRPFGTFEPVLSAEGYRSYSFDRPHVYLPMWFCHTWSTIRNAVWMSWITKLEGMLYSPDLSFRQHNDRFGYHGTNTVFEIAEINRRLARVGEVMNHLPKQRAGVAVLMSHSQFATDVAEHNHPEPVEFGSPAYHSPHQQYVFMTFFRVMETGRIPNWLDEGEAVEKGADYLLQWPVIMCPGLTRVPENLREVIEAYIAGGGTFVQFKDDAEQFEGAVIADHDYAMWSEYHQENLSEPGIDGERHQANQDLEWRGWNMAQAPTFERDLASWLGEARYDVASNDVLLSVHEAGEASYLLMANNAQSRDNPRRVKHELVPVQTTVDVPAEGVIYDLFDGGRVAVEAGEAPLRLAAGSGAAWLHLPEAPGPVNVAAEVTADQRLNIRVTWGSTGYLPFRLRIHDPSGQEVIDWYRATSPTANATQFETTVPLGANAEPGDWRVTVEEWLTGGKAEAVVAVEPSASAQLASVATGPVSIYFDDAARIARLLAGEANEPPYEQLNWEAEDVFDLDPTRFAVFGEQADADRVAEALRGQGMTVEVNPAYEIVPFEQKPGYGGSGGMFRESTFENIYAHAIVLPGHALLAEAMKRGHINRPTSETFPGPGRAFVQWGSSCFQAGWQNVFVLGDAEAGIAWLLEAIESEAVPAQPEALTPAVEVDAKGQAPAPLRGQMRVDERLAFYDTPVGVGVSPDGQTRYVLLYDGSVTAHDSDGNERWRTQPLFEGATLAVSPTGDRIAVAGYPGLAVLDADSGEALGSHHLSPRDWPDGAVSIEVNLMVGVAWNDAGTLVAGGWTENEAFPHDPVVLDADGDVVTTVAEIAGEVMGVAFVPGTDTLLIGAEELTAVDARSGEVLWRNAIDGAQAFAFSDDGRTGAAGGWGRVAGAFDLEDGQVTRELATDSVVGGVALLPDGRLIVANWGGTHPLRVVDQDGASAVWFDSAFGFQHVRWSPAHDALLAAEQGGRLWLLDAAGQPLATLDEDEGTTVYRLSLQDDQALVARMDRTVQTVTIAAE